MNQLFLDPDHLSIVQTILKKYPTILSVFAFGSRVTGQHKPHSDLDLCIISDKPFTFAELAELQEDFSESNLPMRIDIVEWLNITPEFQKIIQNQKVEISKP